MITELLASLPDQIKDIFPCPAFDDRTYWVQVNPSLALSILSDAHELTCKEYPSLGATSYLQFSRTGERTGFETRYFERRKMLGTATLAYCLKPDAEFLDIIIDGIWAICEESSWCLPAHNSYIRDTEQLPLPDTTRPIIDLFSAETSALLALVRSLLKPVLDAVEKQLCTRIEYEIQDRVLGPYLGTHFWWMGNGDEKMCNWTVWCTQNILLSALLLPTNQFNRRLMVYQACYSIDCFLKDYGLDGCCDEGAQYYRHAGLCLYTCLDLLNQACGDIFLPAFKEEKIRNIAAYIQNIHATGPYYFNFADCSARSGPCTVREYLFAKATQNTELEEFACISYHQKPRNERHLKDEINLYYRLLALEHDDKLSLPNQVPLAKDIWYESVGIFISRDPVYTLSVKAGDNADSHNHNDCGSITLYKDGRPLLIDLGVERYTKATFSANRYSIWTMRSTYHNLTNFPPYEQQAGSQFKSEVLNIDFSGNPTITMQLRDAYPAEAGLVSYKRKVTHCKGREIHLEETIEGPTSGQLSLLCVEKPLGHGNSISLGGLGKIVLQSPPNAFVVEELAVTDPRLREVWPPVLYRIIITYSDFIMLTIS